MCYVQNSVFIWCLKSLNHSLLCILCAVRLYILYETNFQCTATTVIYSGSAHSMLNVYTCWVYILFWHDIGRMRRKEMYVRIVQRDILFIFRPTALESYSIFLFSVETSRYEPDIIGEKANISLAVSTNLLWVYWEFQHVWLRICFSNTSGPAVYLLGIFRLGAFFSLFSCFLFNCVQFWFLTVPQKVAYPEWYCILCGPWLNTSLNTGTHV